MKKYILKEYGSWGVMSMAFASGLISARHAGPASFAAFLALALLINSKQAATIWIRTADRARNMPAAIFLAQVFTALLLLLPLIHMYGVFPLAPYLLFPAVYLLLLKYQGEHSVATEVSGFVLLSLSSLVAKASAGEGVDTALFGIVALFFTAGVFRVRIQLRRQMSYRIIMVCYAAAAALFCRILGFNILIMAPLIDNIVFSVLLYRVGLQATGWIEMSKGFGFLLLLAAFG